jgi:hypothetical protein
MSDISVALRPFTAHLPLRLSGLAAVAGSRYVGIGTTVVLPRNGLGRRFARWMAGIFTVVRADAASDGQRDERDRRYHHPRREAFMADAAMAREMHRL